MEQPTASMLVIGDELLSGRTQDANMHHLANKLTEIGINLSEARFIRDDAAVIVSNIVELSTKFDYLFTSGGIGPTHDDITTDCVAKAFGRQVSVRSDAFNILKKYYDGKGIELNEARLRMARIPEKADLIENLISGAPGYIIENVYVMAGVPKIFLAMLQTVLPNLKKVRFKSEMLNKSLKLTVSNSGIRSVDKKGSFDQLIKSAKTKNLSFRIKKIKKTLLNKSA